MRIAELKLLFWILWLYYQTQLFLLECGCISERTVIFDPGRALVRRGVVSLSFRENEKQKLNFKD